MPDSGEEAPKVEMPPPESLDEQRFLPSGEEAGSAPEDRAFRPDVEGLRAIAILLVVLFHVGIPQMRGGFVGVDVFFAISGFVITGLLLRERGATGRTGFLLFYARRARRILPAALLVIIVSLVASYVLVGAKYATFVASDSRWAALFLVNFHFASVYPNFLVARPPSPLQQYWSLAIEEQFYLVYPAFFVALLAFSGKWSIRARLAVGLSAVIVISFLVSVASSHTGHLGSYDSPFTRAWELALGGLVAVGAAQLEKIPTAFAAVMTWAGLAGILVAAVTFTVLTPYPGAAAALPVVGAALIIAGGTSVPRWGTEAVLRLLPFRWIGRWSYSWYLWHSAVLVLAAEYAHTAISTTSIAKNLALVAFALVVAAATYFWVENPIRHSDFLIRSPRASLIGAGLLIATCVAFTFAF